MAELADALDLGSSGETRKSSSLFTRTNFFNIQDNYVDNLGHVPVQISHHNHPKPRRTIKPYKSIKIFFSYGYFRKNYRDCQFVKKKLDFWISSL